MSAISVDHFIFTRHRAGSPDLAFSPDGAASLTLCSMSDDTLTLGGMRPGVLQSGDRVSAARGGETVFRGDVDARSRHAWRGASEEETLTVTGPWRRLSRLPYTQTWVMMVERELEGGGTSAAAETVSSSRTVLNQNAAGSPLPVRQQVLEILALAASRGIVAAPASPDVAAIPADLALPYDEQRDLTCAQALARELRFTPGLAIRFNYSQNPPRLLVVSPSVADAAWIADYAAGGALLDVKETQAGLPPLGCLLEITVTGSVEGAAYAFRSAQESGDTSDPERTLRASLPVSGADSSHDRRKLDLTTATIPVNLNDVPFWREWHPDLKTVGAGGLKITDASRTGDMTGSNAWKYPRFVTKGGVGMAELKEAGVVNFRAETLLCTAVVTTSSYLGEGNTVKSVETANLSIDIIATDAMTLTYKWDASSDLTSGEFVPAGLAAALLAAHLADGSSSEVLCSLKAGAALPRPGDTRGGLTAHTVSADCRALTVSVGFGPPAALGPVDLAGFLSGFRNIRRSSLSTSRATGEKKDGAVKDETFLLPATSSGWAKQGDNVVSAAPAAGDSGGTATMDPADLKTGEKAKFREVKIPGENPGDAPSYQKVLATEPTAKPTADDGTGAECQHGDAPGGSGAGGSGTGTGGSGTGTGGHKTDGENGGFPGEDYGADRDNNDFPGKTGPCW